jgi:hypothetical protein
VGIIKTINEVVREQINAITDTAKDRYKDSIRPLYAGEYPRGIGSCFFLKVASENFLITAAHVLDEHASSPLYVGGTRDLVPFEGTYRSTKPPHGKAREDDHYDFAWKRLTDEFIGKLGSVPYLPESELSFGQTDIAERVCVAMGFPASRNKRPVNEHLVPQFSTYCSMQRKVPDLLKRFNLTEEDHITIDQRAKSRDGRGVVGKTINPHGVSGGPLFDFGKAAHPLNLSPDRKPVGKLIGVVIEGYPQDKVLLCVKMSVVIDKIYKEEGLTRPSRKRG